jgi:glycine C-acetyltransferase
MDSSCVELSMGTLSKAIPSTGGFLAGDRDLIVYLQHGAAPFMFSAAVSPSAIAAADASLRILRAEPERLERLRRNADYLRNGLRGLGYDTGSSESPIIPIIVGDDEATYRLSRALFGHGVFATAVVFPAVAQGAARLRLCATAAQTRSQLDSVLRVFEALSVNDRSPAHGEGYPLASGGDGLGSVHTPFQVSLNGHTQ